MTKKVYKNVFPVITKNLNWEISTKNVVTFKTWDRGEGWQILILWGRGGDSPMHAMFNIYIYTLLLIVSAD